ncbi:MAG: hypothetical protein AB7G28_05490 [Pirellulales bacterium]
MAGKIVLIDAGPLVALLAADDAAHAVCVDESRRYSPPFITTWAVLAEAAWLLRRKPDGIPRLMELISSGLVQCAELVPEDAIAISALATTYSDLKPDLADLTILRLASRSESVVIFTLDRRDFTVYRDVRGKPLELIPAQI